MDEADEIEDAIRSTPGCPHDDGDAGPRGRAPGFWWYAWPVTDVVSLTPISFRMRCQSKFAKLPGDIRSQIRAQFRSRPDLPDLAEPPLPGPLDGRCR